MEKFEYRTQDNKPEKAILVGVEQPSSKWNLDSSMAELARLAQTAGAQVVACTTQKLEHVQAKTFVGIGKAEEIADLCRAYGAEIVIFDDELTPSQQSNIEQIVPKDVKVVDRTALILDIFGLHARSKEGRLQVRLAQNEYLLPRLRGMWAHLASNRMGGGVGSRFGEGESQLEVDRRIVRKRITSIKRELASLEKTRTTQRHGRKRSGMFSVSLVGYTNAGKSSLMNAMTHADVLSKDALFATLDSTTRKLELPEGREVTLTDTVGFIQKLPTKLIESFKSTLEEITQANLILHVIDASSPESDEQRRAVEEILESIGASQIDRIDVYNKIDLLTNAEREALISRHEHALFVSAITSEGITELIEHIAKAASAREKLMHVLIPYTAGNLVSLAHERCGITSEQNTEHGTELRIRVSKELVSRFKPYQI